MKKQVKICGEGCKGCESCLRGTDSKDKTEPSVAPKIIHKTTPVQVWADVDEDIAPLVKYLNTIPGIRTHASCQGTIGEGGAEPYGPQVMVSYQTEEAEMRVRKEFDCVEIAQSTFYVRLRKGWTAPEEDCKAIIDDFVDLVRPDFPDEFRDIPSKFAAACCLRCGAEEFDVPKRKPCGKCGGQLVSNPRRG